ncbi:MAG: hypothetical protein JXL84_24575, partial [Deltaproteobacteria bacterium]|nr:hypothetical protein [Deltaproteobacteria bacterium]
FCRKHRQITGYRITVIGRDGRVLGESDRASTGMENHGSRPEVQSALKGGVGTAVRYSETLRTEMLYLALALKDKVVRLALPMKEMKAFRNEVMIFFALALYLAPAAAILVAFLLAKYGIHDRERHGKSA